MARITDRMELQLDVSTSVGLVRSGDKLVVAMAATATDMDIDVMEQKIMAKLPGVDVIAIRAEGIVVYRS